MTQQQITHEKIAPRATTAGAAAAAIIVAAMLGAALGSGSAAATTDEAALIEDALSAAPPNLKDTVTVKDFEGNVLRAGTGNYTCYPAPEGIAGPMCVDDEWQRWMAAWMAQEPFTPSRLAIAYMMAGDSADGGASNINPFDGEPTADNDWIVEGPHVMIIVPDQSVLEGLPITTDTDEPYVMWSGTDYAHIMLPVDLRPEQRPLPGQ
jgi:hypothetical protein